MTLMAAREARQAGYRIGILTASPMGINIYRRLGFKETCIVGTYEWARQAPRDVVPRIASLQPGDHSLHGILH